MTSSDDLQKRLFGGAAYRLFREELTKYLASTIEIDGPACPPAEVRKAWSIRFHTVKGGAGFFKLDAVAAVAGKLEDLLAGPDAEGRWQEVAPLVNELRALDNALPPAAS